MFSLLHVHMWCPGLINVRDAECTLCMKREPNCRRLTAPPHRCRTPEDDGRDPEEVEKEKRRKEAKSRAVVLEMIGAETHHLQDPAPKSHHVCSAY